MKFQNFKFSQSIEVWKFQIVKISKFQYQNSSLKWKYFQLFIWLKNFFAKYRSLKIVNDQNLSIK